MKKYNVKNYIKYKSQVSSNISRLPDTEWHLYTRDELIVKFLPLVENLAKKFSTSQQASGVMTINDLIQEGSIGLMAAVDKIDWVNIIDASNPEQRLKSFLSKRIRGAIRRAIDSNRGTMRIPEHKMNKIRKDFDSDKQAVRLFFNSIFLSLDAENNTFDPPDTSQDRSKEMLGAFLKSVMIRNLSSKEYLALKLSYGIDCKKHSANEIASVLGLNGKSAYVRVSQLKRQAKDKLVECIDYEQIIDFL